MRFYIDTSVFGGYYDSEFEHDTIKLFDEIKKGIYSIFISTLTLSELIEAPKHVRNLLTKFEQFTEIVEINEKVLSLAQRYIKEGVLTSKYINDALHIAAATVYRVDVLLSWNFQHMVNFFRIRQYNSINLKYGYSTIDIRSPREVLK